jgi:hypothetical protein
MIAQLVLGLGGAGGREVDHQPELVPVPYLVVAVEVAVHEHGRGRRGEHGVGPVAPAKDGPVLIWPYPRPEPVAQGRSRGRRQHRAGERADGGLGAPAGGRVVQGGQEPHDLPGRAVRIDRVGDVEQGCPGHAPGDQEHGIGAAGDDLGQERDRGFPRECRQDGDLLRQLEFSA